MLVEEKDTEAEDRLLERAKEPPYDFMQVPACVKDLAESVLIKVASRRMCTYAIGEIFHVCNEAARRQAARRFQQQQLQLQLSPPPQHSQPRQLQQQVQQQTKLEQLTENSGSGGSAGAAEKDGASLAKKQKSEPKKSASNGSQYALQPQLLSPHPVPTEQDAPPTLPGQPPASPTVKYVIPDANTFEKGEIILCPSCKKNMKAPMRARALRCANCRSEIYPKHRKPGWADALYQQLQQTTKRNLSAQAAASPGLPAAPSSLTTAKQQQVLKAPFPAGAGLEPDNNIPTLRKRKALISAGGGDGGVPDQSESKAKAGRSSRGAGRRGKTIELPSPAAPSPIRFDKPLSLDYIADRLDIDNPLRGYMVRSSLCDSSREHMHRWPVMCLS